ncbi:hypothetical protein QTO30_16990 [Yoonia sp. GPGPB17]|uniref:hypothetical protein n=1 Tax=Yoonia sp. GPGPB17 TaxID=3026147 RepID=UPI0030BAC681
MVVRGVPHRIAKDAWWLDDADPPQGVRAGPVFVAAILLADVLIWGFRPGAGLAVWMMLLGGAVALTVARRLVLDRALKSFTVLILAVLPMAEVVQFGTVMIALLGLFVFGVMITSDRWDGAIPWRAVARIPGYGLVQTVRDALAMRIAVPSKGSFRGLLFDWALPVGFGGIFLVLFAAANPLVDQWLLVFADIDPSFLPRIERVFFWGAWPLWSGRCCG